MTDPTTANIFRIFGTVESGQCTLVLDEVEKIDKNQDMMSILKTGYDNGKKVQRVNPFTNKQDHYHMFGIKVMLAERTPNVSVAAGVIDRTFVMHNHKGIPEIDIKEIRSPFSNHVIKKDILFLRKVLFVYRLIYHNKTLKNIETGLIGRDKELCKPILQIFCESKAQEKIERALEHLLDDKNSRKSNSLERDVLEVVVDLFEVYKDGIMPFGEIWEALKNKTNGNLNEYNKNQLETEDYGSIYRITISRNLR